MAQFHRFEDALPAWRAHARLIGTAGRAASPRPRDGGGIERAAEVRPGTTGPGSRPHDRIASACLTWLARHGCWPNQGADMPRVEAEVQAAVYQLVEPLPEDEPGGEIRGAAWAVPAAVGAGVGALIVSPLTWIWFDNRAIGLFVGGTLGAFLAVRGLAALLDRPALVAALRSAASLSGGGMVVGGMWRAIRGQSIGLFRSVMWLTIAPLLLTVLQSRLVALRSGPSANDPLRQRAELVQVADLALAVCWTHPDRLPPQAEVLHTGPTQLTGAIWAALSRLHADLARTATGQELRDSCEEAFQRFQEDGYEWPSVTRGTPYAVEMTEAYDLFGSLAAGQLVRTQRSAVTRRGQVIHKGEIRRA